LFRQVHETAKQVHQMVSHFNGPPDPSSEWFLLGFYLGISSAWRHIFAKLCMSLASASYRSLSVTMVTLD